MKLVDILARDFESLDERYELLAQDGDGFIANYKEIDRFNETKDEWDGDFDIILKRVEIAEDYMTANVTKTQWQAAVDALYPPLELPEEWNGSGLPPVGTVCEMHIDDGDFWAIGKVVAHAVLSDETVAVAHNESEVFHGSDGNFRPIRTPQQIAAEERESCIVRMTNDAGNASSLAQRVYADLYDAGYRKIEIVESE